LRHRLFKSILFHFQICEFFHSLTFIDV
jgi:hypothetical protein